MKVYWLRRDCFLVSGPLQVWGNEYTAVLFFTDSQFSLFMVVMNRVIE